ncbi:hypothetical protein [Burkholderia ubonensis]|uniref:hypothetical protein n=1 Tax=Burkholderia ubonensis TaxID=101571 RepID=UPI000ACCB8A8|nr:hypothetical protein [Burkholderia ubonensis]
MAELVSFPRNTSPVDLAEGFLEFAQKGCVKWAVMVICEQDNTLRYDWSLLPSNLAAVGAIEFLKLHLMDQ